MIIKLISLENDQVLLEVANPQAANGYSSEKVLNFLESTKQVIIAEDGSQSYQISGYLLQEDFRIQIIE